MAAKTIDIHLSPEAALNPGAIRRALGAKTGWRRAKFLHYRILKRSIDGRSRQPRINLRVEVSTTPLPPPPKPRPFSPKPLTDKSVIVVGAGPAGYFTALGLLERGICPIVLERGKDVRSRRFDLKPIYTQGKVHPHSNYCFGEGGAGTYSDGKLYTRSGKRGDVARVLDLFVAHGAREDIRINAHPHLGSNVLPRIVRAMRENILAAGGRIRFESQVTRLILEHGRAVGVCLAHGEEVRAHAVVLATGHSARDIYQALHHQDIALEAKPFAMGVRLEHPQALIDRIFYRTGKKGRNPLLPAASYRIACRVKHRGVFSFCMCPGGHVVPAATAPGELVLNGMSLSHRNAEFANAGLVTEVKLSDIPGNPHQNPLAALEFQKAVEQRIFNAGDGSTQKAPAQRVGDFLAGRISKDLPRTSYIPGVYPANLNQLLPNFIVRALGEGLKIFGKKYKGFDDPRALMLAVESRTSAPVHIPRDRESFMHPRLPGLFPAGEGAGHAGGIVSAAMDGLNVARAVTRYFSLD